MSAITSCRPFPALVFLSATALLACRNLAPEIAAIPDQTNSPETRDTFVQILAADPEGAPLSYAVEVADPTVATAAVNAGGLIPAAPGARPASTAAAWAGRTAPSLVLTPLARGSTDVTVKVSDGYLESSARFTFTVGDVTKVRSWTVDVPREHAVSIRNASDHAVSFELRHNAALIATSGEQLVDEVRALPDDIPGEPFERKLWRFVRDGSYHFEPLTGAYWQHDPLLFLDSVGFGFCDDVTSVYVALAGAAGFGARGWYLTGHVVPEILAGGSWKMFDPDLAVYYTGPDGQLADVASLAANPTLLTAPYFRFSRESLPYSDPLAQIYSTVADNWLLEAKHFVPARGTEALRLPAQASVTYPGRWSALPSSMYGPPVAVSAQLRVDLPPSFAGVVDWPLVLWDVQGTGGQVRLNGAQYAVGAPELTAAIQNVLGDRPPGTGIEIVDAGGSGVSLIYLLNPVRFSLTPSAEVRVRALEAWTLETSLVHLDAATRVTYDSVAPVARRW